jgi:GH18 family chitinase
MPIENLKWYVTTNADGKLRLGLPLFGRGTEGEAG